MTDFGRVGYATIDIYPDMSKLGSRVSGGAGAALAGAGRRAGDSYAGGMRSSLSSKARTMFAPLSAGVAAIGLAKLAKDSVMLEAQFGKTMNVLKATTGAPQREMKELSRLALRMGADTAFSANDASQAMLELARGGIKPAEIQAGALKGTLTLAAAGELEMGEAANTAVKAMGQFNLEGRDMDRVAAALAGAANASSASVRDLSQSLAAGGLAANSVGFSVQETTAVLAAFSNKGLEGSDAGTALKTMLDRLQPSTNAQAAALRDLGVITADGTNKFIKANGEYRSAAEVAGILERGTRDLDAAERKRLITQAFGSDAQRAATIFAEEGADGLRKLMEQTRDTSAAQRMAGANMKGTAGALERLSGSAETAQLKFGMGLAPAVRRVSDDLGNFLDDAPLKKWGRASGDAIEGFADALKRAPLEKWADDTGDALGEVKDFFKDMRPIAGVTFDVLKEAAPYAQDLVDAFKEMPDWAQKLIVGGGVAAIGANKLGNLLGPRGGGLAGGLLRSTKPVPVIVMNPGFGKPGKTPPIMPGGLPDGPDKGGSKPGFFSKVKGGALAAGRLLASAPLPALGALGADTRMGEAIPANLKAINNELLQIAGARTGLESVKGSMAGLDDIYASLAARDPGRGLNRFNILMGQTDLSASALSAAMPKTAHAIEQAGLEAGESAKRTDYWKRTLLDTSDASTRYGRTLASLPKRIQTKIGAPGAIETRGDVVKLARQYDLTPRQVRTLMRASDFATPMVKRIMADLREYDRQRPNPKLLADRRPASQSTRLAFNDIDAFGRARRDATVGVNTGPARSAIAGIRTALNQIPDEQVLVKVSRTDGGRLIRAGGGPVYGPGTATSDSIPAMLSNGEYVINAASTSRHRALLEAINADRYADGGPVGTHASTTLVAPGAAFPSGRVALTITNWDDGTGYFEVVADDRIAARRAHDSRHVSLGRGR